MCPFYFLGVFCNIWLHQRPNIRKIHKYLGLGPFGAGWSVRLFTDFAKKLLARHPARILVWEGEPNAETLGKLKDQGIGSVLFEPAGNRPGEGDYFEVMERNRQRLLESLERL